MNRHAKTFQALWRDAWQGESLSLDDLPGFPLARTVEMPPGHDYPSGALSFRLHDLRLDGVERLAAVRRKGAHGRVEIDLSFERLRVEGRYAVESKPDPVAALDTAGDLMELPAEARRPRAGGADPTSGSMSTDQEEWLANARSQRTQLSQTENGRKLLWGYSEHSEVYDQAFKSPTLQSNWSKGGAVKEMAGDTNRAVQAGGTSGSTTINSTTKLYGSQQLSYNENSFIQQTNVATASLMADPNYPNVSPESSYYKAAEAALAFGSGISHTTGNTKKKTVPMDQTGVYAHVQEWSGQTADFEPSREEVMMLARIDPTSGGADGELRMGAMVLDQDDIERLSALRLGILRERAEQASIVGEPLFTGECRASLGKAKVRVFLEEGTAPRAEVELQAFDFEIDDSTWSGSAGEVARRRLAQMYFVRSLLHDAISDQLERALPPRVLEVDDAALQGDA
ncbi:MAG: hypothetical protein AAGC60_19580 [Acidobacteriota bacterium]